eukprot:CAMPEP_0181141098 /NCGR_PEP_ID=MMETSP1071-20121207/35646_1 /TAXON_ID=35127 /ORGANISM="Thalassiosira sp., Strain NH16" /LENGTH=1449 /DNA_ID=CAMNT_0023228073 /DNA_START=59 /DNA_END=4408 /DNA_ORIENTATION=+
MMDVDDTPPEVVSGRSSASSSSLGDACSRPTSAPVTNNGNGFANLNPPRAIRTAPTPTNAGNGEQNVRVVARVRPLSTKELNEKSGESILAHPRQSNIRVVEPDADAMNVGGGGDGKRKFEFDSVFGTDSTQQEVYENTCGDMISSSIFKGFNATILAYGQTGSGKTFTMGTDGSTGSASPRNDDNSMAPPDPSEGVIARAVHDLFQAKNSLPNGNERVKVTMSYLEIYNEQAIDLLNEDPASANTTLQVRDSKTEGVVIPNLKHFQVSSPKEVRALMEMASMKRATGSTHMNSVSSRSHAICTLNVSIAPNDNLENEEDEQEQQEDLISPRSVSSSSNLNQHGMKAKLTLVDLAGSERIKRTGAEGARMKEGININKGLFVLGQVVSALSEHGQRIHAGGSNHHAHIPYRDSKLTRLLQDSLGGNSRTVMIACISPAESNIEESINTLRYAERTRNIKNSAVRNVVSSGGLSAREAAALRRENQQLKLELARMESKMIVSSGGSSSGFSFGSLVGPADISTETIVSQLRVQCSSLLAEIDLLRGCARDHSKEVLEASLRADKWQTKSEAIVQLAKTQGVDLSSKEVEDVSHGSDDIVSNLRSQLAKCKAELLEARTEAIVARAAAGAIIAGKADLLGNIGSIATTSEDSLNLSGSLEDDSENARNNELLTTELSAVSATIEQKEAMVLQISKERACMDNVQLHFENSLRLLQTEVDAMTAERDELVVKMSSNEKEINSNNNQHQRKRKANNDPMTKRLREQISKLEGRIDELKVKANEHKKSMKMKDNAEKKCARLLVEIAEDKRRRADLQRKLKDTSVEMRAEKRAAKQNAAKMMKDTQKLKIELRKMESAHQKQAAVLKRKIDQASAKEKARAELERKRRSAEKMRLASSFRDNADVKESRKIELSSWIDREFEYTLIKLQIDDQRRQLNDAVMERRKLMKTNDDTVDVKELKQMDDSVRALQATIEDLEVSLKKAFPAATDTSMTSMFRFLEMNTFKGLSKLDAKYVLSYVFDMCTSMKQDMASMIENKEDFTKSSINSALAKEHQLHEREITKIKMEHADATLNLLESMQGTVNSNFKLNSDGSELGAQVGTILGAYNESWSSTTEALRSDLDEIKEVQEGLEQTMDKIAKGMAIPSKKKPKAKKKDTREDWDSDAFESEESYVEGDDGEDSEYEPTPAKKARGRKRQSPKAPALPNSPPSPIGEDFIDDIDNKKKESLKKACKKLGVPVTGKKDILKKRVKETFLNNSVLNSSMALPIGPTDEEKDGSFNVELSAIKKVNFNIGDVDVDPEFQPIHEKPNPSTESIKKKLWQEMDDDIVNNDESEKAKTPSKKMTPSKRRMSRSPSSDSNASVAEKENTPRKGRKPLGFGSSSPRPLSSHNAKAPSRTPVHLKQTIATSRKRLIPDDKQSTAVTKRNNISASARKRTKRGMNIAVSRALQQNF